MKLLSHLPPSGPALYVAPLLNTVLLLLIFFLLGSSFIVRSGVSVSLPESASRLSGFEDAHVITMPAGPDATLFYDGKQMSMDELHRVLEQEPAGTRRVIVHGDQRVPYGRVMEVGSLALNLGFEIAYATTPQGGAIAPMAKKELQGLIFHWLVHEGRSLKLFVGLVATFMTLAGIALLFQVVYPAARQRPLPVQRVVLLDASSPAARPVLEKVRDHDFLQLVTNSDSSIPDEAKAPVFTPSFQRFELQPKDLPEARANASTLLPRLFRADKPLLPPVPSGPVMQARTIAPPQSLQTTVTEGLAKRPITRPLVFRDARFAEMINVAYRVAVAADGHVTLVVPLSDPGSQPDVQGEVRSSFCDLRFQPKPGQAVEWGTVTLKWYPDAR